MSPPTWIPGNCAMISLSSSSSISRLMPAHFADSAELPATLEHSLRLDFHPDQLPLRWSHCSATADFLANYYQGLLKAQLPPSGLADLRHSISYLANELLEN